jgi:thiamine biosynthesis lipoprotein
MPACVALVLIVGIAAGSAAPAPRVVEKQRYAMGTVFRVLVFTADASRASSAIDAALAEVVRLDAVLSHYDERSELSRLMRHGTDELFSASADLYTALEDAIAVARLSDGRFDVTVGPLVRVWREAREQGREPTDAELGAAGACVGANLIALEPPNLVHLRSSCLSLDLGGIGKGVAVDAAIDVLRRHGITDAVVNGGGSTMRAIGSAPGRTGWPVQTDAVANVVDLQDAALSISQASGEIIAPGRRTPAVNPLTVTVIASRATTADGLSTALLLSTLDEGRAMLRLVPDVMVSWIRPDGHVASTWTSRPDVRLDSGASW